jgi:hypothetical protein
VVRGVRAPPEPIENAAIDPELTSLATYRYLPDESIRSETGAVNDAPPSGELDSAVNAPFEPMENSEIELLPKLAVYRYVPVGSMASP